MPRRSDIPFAEDSSRLFLPWMSMLMVFIAVLTLAGGITAYGALSNWNKNVSGSMTVQIPTVDEKGNPRGEILTKDIETTLTILRASPGVMGAVVLTDDQMAALMAPWIGNQSDISGLPLPKLIDISVDTNNPPKLEQLFNDLADNVPMAVLDSHRLWLENLIKMAGGLMKLTGFILLLLVLTTAFTIVYATRTSLSVHKPVISLVHMMGAGDFYVAIQYASRSFRLTLLGGLIGLLLALPVIFGVAYFFQSLASEFIPGLSRAGWLTLFCIPLVFSTLAFLTTLHTVMSTLKRVL